MNATELEFEKSLIELENHLVALEAFAQAHPELDLTEGIDALKQNADTLTKRTFQKLSRWDKVRLARHAQRPQAAFYINALLDEPTELHSDKLYGDDRALIGGFAWFDGHPLVYLAQQKGTNLEERQEMNFGYTHPEGYRKARRLMQLANKFNRPIICFVDTPGAHFDLRSEEYGQAMAIAENLAEMMQLRVPILVVIIGEGGSGGALAIAVGNRVLMMEYAVYCVAPLKLVVVLSGKTKANTRQRQPKAINRPPQICSSWVSSTRSSANPSAARTEIPKWQHGPSNVQSVNISQN